MNTEMLIGSRFVRGTEHEEKIFNPRTGEVILSLPEASTEQVEAALKQLLPMVRIARMDRDSTSRKGSMRQILTAWERREYEAGDLVGALIVIAATNDTDTNVRVFEDAERRAMLVNVVDVPPLCNFILPAIVRTGPLAVAISTAGASPALAKRMKREIGELFGEPYATLAVLLNDARGWAKATLPTYQDRKQFFEGIVNGEPDPIALLRAGDVAGVRELIDSARRACASAVG